MKLFSKKKKYSMGTEQAESTLQNVYSACDIKVLVQKASIKEIQEKHRREAFSYRIILITILVFLCAMMLLPFAFHHSPATVNPQEQSASEITVFQHHFEEGLFYLTLTGGDVDYENILITDSDGNSIPLTMVDPESATMTFPYDSIELNIYIPDKNGSSLHLLLSPK